MLRHHRGIGQTVKVPIVKVHEQRHGPQPGRDVASEEPGPPVIMGKEDGLHVAQRDRQQHRVYLGNGRDAERLARHQSVTSQVLTLTGIALHNFLCGGRGARRSLRGWLGEVSL